MTDDSIHALGPLLGPDFITIEINDETGMPFALEIFPDANNAGLTSNSSCATLWLKSYVGC